LVFYIVSFHLKMLTYAYGIPHANKDINVLTL